jgi:hypothetical protein
MATRIKMKQKDTGLTKDGFIGYSWTTLFFGSFPALFRGDFMTFIGVFVVLLILAFISLGIGTFIAMFAWSFMYNKYYTKKLIEKGYQFDDTPELNQAGKAALGIS